MNSKIVAQVSKPPKIRASKQYQTSPLSDSSANAKNFQAFTDKEKPVYKHVVKQKRPQQVIDILQKKQLNCIDLQFLSKIVSTESVALENDDRLRIKSQLKKLKDAQFHTIKDLLSLWSTLGMGQYPNALKYAFVKHFSQFKFESVIVNHYPSAFLKQVAFILFENIFPRSKQQSLEVLKQLGTVLSVQQLRKVDSICSQGIFSMDSDMLIRFLNAFRQLKKRGIFSQQAVDLIIQKKQEISPKYLLMNLICFYELDHADKVHKFYPRLLLNIKQYKKQIGFSQQQVIALLQILHKYKSGQRSLWEAIEQRLSKQNILTFDQIFAILSGLTRAYQPNQNLLIKMLDFQPKMEYVSQLKDMQFVEFFVVTYFHFSHLDAQSLKKYQSIIINSLETVKLSSVFKEIKHFFLYLFSPEKQKENNLKKSYPNDLMLALLSLAFPIRDAVDIQEQQKYKAELIQRYRDHHEKWENHTKIIIAEEFIRYKLMSAKSDHFRQHLAI